MKKRHLIEIKLGTFFLIAIVLLFITLLSIKEVHFFQGTYKLRVKFSFVEGIRAPSPVRFCGVNVGEISNVQVKSDKENGLYVMVDVKIQQGVKIPANAMFCINSLSIFGEKYLEIFPPEEESKGVLKAKDIVSGVSPVPLFKVFDTMNKTMKEINNLFQDEQFKNSLKNTLINVEDASGKLNRILGSVEKQEGTIGKLFYSDSLHTKAEEFIEELKANPWKLLSKPREKPTKLNRGKSDGSMF